MQIVSLFESECNISLRSILDENNEPWFVASDICKALDIQNVTQAVERLDNDECVLHDFKNGHGSVNIVNESGLYNLIFSSRKPEAKKFKKWITSEVLPAIRKTGQYKVSDNYLHNNKFNIEDEVEELYEMLDFKFNKADRYFGTRKLKHDLRVAEFHLHRALKTVQLHMQALNVSSCIDK